MDQTRNLVRSETMRDRPPCAKRTTDRTRSVLHVRSSYDFGENFETKSQAYGLSGRQTVVEADDRQYSVVFPTGVGTEFLSFDASDHQQLQYDEIITPASHLDTVSHLGYWGVNRIRGHTPNGKCAAALTVHLAFKGLSRSSRAGRCLISEVPFFLSAKVRLR